jgi:hypothetical protein
MEPTGPTRDPGLQPERTRFAWRRTTMTFVIVTLLVLRMTLIHDRITVVGWIAAVISVAGLFLILWMAHRRIGAMAQAQPVAVGRTLTVVALSVLGYAVLGILLVLS